MNDKDVLPSPAPSDNPTFKIYIDGNEMPGVFHIVSITVLKSLNKISMARIVILDGDPSKGNFVASSSDLFVPGKNIEIQAGYHSKDTPIFTGIIIKQKIQARDKRSSLLTVECRHEAVRMTSVRENACYLDITDSEVFEKIIQKYNIKHEVDSTSLKHKELVQYHSTDWDFMLSRADASGMFVFTCDKRIKIKKPDFSTNPKLTLNYGSTMLEIEAELDARNQHSGVTGISWNMADQVVQSSDADEPPISLNGNISISELADVTGKKNLSLRHSGTLTEQEMKIVADARLMKSRLSKIQGRVKFNGFADINPGDMIELKGVGDRFNGKAFVSAVRHEIAAGCWNTDAGFGLENRFYAEQNDISALPASGLIPAVCGLQIGIVTDINDPEAEERVQVKLPLVDNESEGVWARVAALDAGNNRGSFFRPEVGDEVVLGFFNNDPRTPVILGMLNSSAKPAPVKASDKNDEKGFFTRSSLKLIFNDKDKSVKIETPDKNIITVSDASEGITLEDKNGNKIVMNSNGIVIESDKDIKIKAAGDLYLEGNNTNLKALMQFKAEGTSGAEMTSNATAVIKGTMVRIN